MRRFFAATCTALALLVATPVHAQPLRALDVASWLDGLTAWVEEFLAANKDEAGDPPPPADDTDSDDVPPEDSARGEICGNG